jgi:hypothetical protein
MLKTAEEDMITKERLAQIEFAPREACISNAEARELTDAYRNRVPGFRMAKGQDGAWMQFYAPSGKSAMVSLNALVENRGDIVSQTILEWANEL